jgi:hypothetical protein
VEVEFASRIVMFRLFYLGLTPYDSARHFHGLSELSWSKWTEDVRQRCGTANHLSWKAKFSRV